MQSGGAPPRVFFQLLVFAMQPLPLRFRPPQILTQALNLMRLIVDDLLGIARRCLGPSPRHAIVIAEARLIAETKFWICRVTR